MKQGMALVTGLGLGAGLMYWLDPAGGRRRRARVRQKLVHVMHGAQEGAEIVSRDIAHRTRGLLAEARAVLRADEDVDDDVLEARVRERLGRVSSHPGAISVFCRDGTVELRGPILRRELESVLKTVESVRGVDQVDSMLEPHEEQGNVPGLQGEPALRTGHRLDVLQRNWAPATRFLVGTAGLGLMSYGLGGHGFFAKAFATVGAALLGRSAFNRPVRELTGLAARGRGIQIHKSVVVDGPLEDVFGLWQHFQDFPKFMSHVEEVRAQGGGRYLWRVTGPAGTRFEWQAVVTAFEPNRRIAWRSAPGASVQNSGVIRFSRSARGGTLIDIQLSYRPPAGMVGHGLAHLLGADPKKQLDDDMIRFKSLVESGKATGHQRITRDEILGRNPS